MVTNLDAIFLVEQPVQIDYRENMFRVLYRVGRDAQFEVALPPRTFFKAMSDAQRAVNSFHDERERGGSNVHKIAG